jgi:hypothetical protein
MLNFSLTFTFPWQSEPLEKKGGFYEAKAQNGYLEIKIIPVITPETKEIVLELFKGYKENESEISLPKEPIRKLLDLALRDLISEGNTVEKEFKDILSPAGEEKKEEESKEEQGIFPFTENEEFPLIPEEEKEEKAKETLSEEAGSIENSELLSLLQKEEENRAEEKVEEKENTATNIESLLAGEKEGESEKEVVAKTDEPSLDILNLLESEKKQEGTSGEEEKEKKTETTGETGEKTGNDFLDKALSEIMKNPQTDDESEKKKEELNKENRNGNEGTPLKQRPLKKKKSFWNSLAENLKGFLPFKL